MTPPVSTYARYTLQGKSILNGQKVCKKYATKYKGGKILDHQYGSPVNVDQTSGDVDTELD